MNVFPVFMAGCAMRKCSAEFVHVTGSLKSPIGVLNVPKHVKPKVKLVADVLQLKSRSGSSRDGLDGLAASTNTPDPQKIKADIMNTATARLLAFINGGTAILDDNTLRLAQSTPQLLSGKAERLALALGPSLDLPDTQSERGWQIQFLLATASTWEFDSAAPIIGKTFAERPNLSASRIRGGALARLGAIRPAPLATIAAHAFREGPAPSEEAFVALCRAWPDSSQFVDEISRVITNYPSREVRSAGAAALHRMGRRDLIEIAYRGAPVMIVGGKPKYAPTPYTPPSKPCVVGGEGRHPVGPLKSK